jgi:hypothetical protein
MKINKANDGIDDEGIITAITSMVFNWMGRVAVDCLYWISIAFRVSLGALVGCVALAIILGMFYGVGWILFTLCKVFTVAFGIWFFVGAILSIVVIVALSMEKIVMRNRIQRDKKVKLLKKLIKMDNTICSYNSDLGEF